MKMTVKEAFEKYGTIIIDYTFECHCRQCGKWFDKVDEDYSFQGDLNEFKFHQYHFGVIDLSDEITQISGNVFALYRTNAEEPLCDECDECDD